MYIYVLMAVIASDRFSTAHLPSLTFLIYGPNSPSCCCGVYGHCQSRLLALSKSCFIALATACHHPGFGESNESL